tara:strand:+ start:146 stop:1936 length:1791 start_codon:yes stop_codon:yes gene_type:complete
MASITQRKNSKNYYIRRSVPKDIRMVIGKTEYIKSLGTANHVEAKLLFAEAYAESERLFTLARLSLTTGDKEDNKIIEDNLNRKDIHILAHRFKQQQIELIQSSNVLHSEIARLDLLKLHLETAGMPDEPEDVEGIRKFKASPEEKLKAQYELLGNYVNKILHDNKINIPFSSSSYKLLLTAFESVIPVLQKEAMQCFGGNYDAPNTSPLANSELSIERHKAQQPQEQQPQEQQQTSHRETDTIITLYDEFSAYYKRIKGDTDAVNRTLISYNAAIRQFNEAFPDKLVIAINRRDILDFKGLLLNAPNCQLKAIKSLSLKDQVKYAERENLPRLATKTVRNKLIAVSAVLQYAVQEKLIIDTNPAHGTTEDLTKGNRKIHEEDKGYSREDLDTIFGSELFKTGSQKAESLYGKAYYWLPILAYYTGARAEELAQLYVSDIRKTETDISYISINEDKADKSVKNRGSVRKIPLHDDIIELGFIKYIEQLDSKGRVFPNLSKSSDKRYCQHVSKWLGKYIRGALKVSPSIKTMHGFRHSFKTLARSSGMDSSNIDKINGHHNGTASRDYGSFELKLLKDEIDRHPSLPHKDGLLTFKR